MMATLVCMYVCMYVCDKDFVNFLKIGAYNFNFNYQSNVEGHLPIDALGAPFWALRPTWESLSNDRNCINLIHFFRSYAQKLG